MTNFHRFRFLYLLLLVCIQIGFQSCKKDVKEPIERFQKSTAVATSAIATLYNDLNAYERRLYFQELALDPKQRLEATDAQGKKTPFLDEPFSVTAVQARLALLRHLSTYAERLSTLAGNKSPEQFQANTTSLANSLTALHSTFASLSATSGNSDAARYIGPLSTIAGIVGQLALNQKRDAAVRKAIVDGELPINQLLDFLEQDIDKYVSATRLTGAAQQLSTVGRLYNDERNTLTREQRQKRLDEIAQLAEAYKLLQTASPSSVVRQMKIVHQTLVEAVKSSNPLSIGLILGTIQEYETSVSNLLDAIKLLHDLNQTGK